MEGGGHGLSRQSSALWRSFRNGDFEEEDVWDVLKEKSTTTNSKSSDDSKFFTDSSIVASVSAANHFPSAYGMIPRPNGSGNFQIAPRSAPRSIPQWFTPNGNKNPRKSVPEHDDDGGGGDDDGDSEDEDEEGFDCRVPPHELIAKRLARAQISSFSVFEGVGRTLKGRDLSKVRNAVLTKTGFLESL
ncbi:uncharacterized protein LOC111010482 [Momordica charantia]|uniref:Uncharacterized protein LOC111010482 n=1 Tax=Momordica charantia TaxID=3673 RepID=A0A6J1CEH3_MOMCH|nr:uncharacterized protein LOC111010482 [Momordica charantia]